MRAVVLKTSRNGKHVFIKRPIEKLYPLEIRSETIMVNESDITSSDSVNNLNYDTDDNEEEDRSADRPRRTAAENGILIRRLMGN